MTPAHVCTINFTEGVDIHTLRYSPRPKHGQQPHPLANNLPTLKIAWFAPLKCALLPSKRRTNLRTDGIENTIHKLVRFPHRKWIKLKTMRLRTGASWLAHLSPKFSSVGRCNPSDRVSGTRSNNLQRSEITSSRGEMIRVLDL